MSKSMLTTRLQDDLTVAMKSRDAVATSTLRMLLAAIRTAEVAGEQATDLSDSEVIVVLQSEAKKRQEAAAVYADAGRAESSESELAELAVIARYLPEPISAEELAAIVDAEIERVVADTGVDPHPKMMGPVIAAVRERVGAGADGGTISGVVKARLIG